MTGSQRADRQASARRSRRHDTVCRSFAAALALYCLGAPAMANEAWAAFFDAPGAAVERDAAGTREAVVLPGDVHLSRRRVDGAWTYTGLDRSPHGAVGCIALILRDISRVAAQCEGVLAPEEQARLDAHVGQIATFYETNAVPPITAEAFRAEFARRAAPDASLQCNQITDDFRQFAAQMTDAASTPLIDDLLSVPRLPVTNPCL